MLARLPCLRLAALLAAPVHAECAPDGGFAWVLVAGAFVSNGVVIGLQYCFGIIYKALLADTNAVDERGRSALAFVLSLGFALLNGGGIPATMLVARFGARATMAAGAAMLVAGFAGSALVTYMPLLYLTHGLLVGLGSCFCMVPCILTLSRYFERRRSTAIGVAVAGSGVGAVLLGPLVQWLVTIFGWRGACFGLAATVACFVPPAFAVMRPIYLPGDAGYKAASASVSRSEEDRGDAADTAAITGGDRDDDEDGNSTAWAARQPPAPAPLPLPSSRQPQPVDEPASPLPPVRGAGRIVTLRELLRHRGFMAWVTATALMSGAHFAVLALFNAANADAGVDDGAAAVLVSVQGVAGIAGRLALGRASDVPALRRRKVALLQGSLAATAAAMAGLCAWPGSYAYAACFMAVSGFAAGSVTSMQAPISVDAVGLPSLPVAQGLLWSAQAPAILLLPAAGAALRGATGGYGATWAMCAAFSAGAALMCFWVPRPAADGAAAAAAAGPAPPAPKASAAAGDADAAADGAADFSSVSVASSASGADDDPWAVQQNPQAPPMPAR